MFCYDLKIKWIYLEKCTSSNSCKGCNMQNHELIFILSTHLKIFLGFQLIDGYYEEKLHIIPSIGLKSWYGILFERITF